MKVILLDNIRGVGRIGDIKDVSDGYAKNFLLPRGKARPASAGAAHDIAALKAGRDAAVAMAHEEAEAAARTLAGAVIRLTGKANPKGTLFAARTPADVADALAAQTGIRVAPDQVILPEHLKTLGDHPVSVRLGDGVSADVTVTIGAEK